MHAVLFSISRNKWSIYQKHIIPILQPKTNSSNSNASKVFFFRFLRIHREKKRNLLMPPSRSRSPPCAGFFAIFLVLLTAALRRGAKQGRLSFIGQTCTLWWKMAIATPKRWRIVFGGHDKPRLMGVASHLLSRWYKFVGGFVSFSGSKTKKV